MKRIELLQSWKHSNPSISLVLLLLSLIFFLQDNAVKNVILKASKWLYEWNISKSENPSERCKWHCYGMSPNPCFHSRQSQRKSTISPNCWAKYIGLSTHVQRILLIFSEDVGMSPNPKIHSSSWFSYFTRFHISCLCPQKRKIQLGRMIWIAWSKKMIKSWGLN